MTDIDKWYHRCGFASLDDLESPEWKEVFGRLEEIQSEFLSHQDYFRSSAYQWVRDPLHFVARPWEYAYVYSHLKDFQAQRRDPEPMHVMDFGSGVTFMPFALARENMRITAIDIDPIAETDFNRASEAVSPSPGKATFVLCKEENVIPLPSETFDCAYSVSTLEHIPDNIATVNEIARVLKPRGQLILTIDVCFQGKGEIKPEPYARLMSHLRDGFEWLWPEVSIHPSRTITHARGPYPYLRMLKYPIHRKLLAAFNGQVKRILALDGPLDIVVHGMAIRKK